MNWGVSKQYYFIFRNTKHVLKHKVAIKREAAVTKDMNKEVICFELISTTSLQKLPWKRLFVIWFHELFFKWEIMQ